MPCQPCFEVLGDYWVELVSDAVINVRLVRPPPREWPKVSYGQLKKQLKKTN